jgi:hypothetical protein
MKVGDLVRVDNKAQTIGVVMCVDSASEHRPRIQVLRNVLVVGTSCDDYFGGNQ